MSPHAPLGERASRVIYDDDDREELRDSNSSHLAARSLALLSRRNLEQLLAGQSAPNAGPVLELCPGERFTEQPRAAVCGSVAIAPNYAITAAHCVPDQVACDELAFVANYAIGDEGILPVDRLVVHECMELVLSVESSWLDSTALDFSLVRLKQPIDELKGMPLTIADPYLGQIGISVSPSGGLPLKTSRGEVLEATASNELLYVNADLFEGASGSGFFEEDGGVIGIVLGGLQDYLQTSDGCWTSRRVEAHDARVGEAVVAMRSIANRLAAHASDLPSDLSADWLANAEVELDSGSQSRSATIACRFGPVRPNLPGALVSGLGLAAVLRRRGGTPRVDPEPA